jgi:hypothetical protein
MLFRQPGGIVELSDRGEWLRITREVPMANAMAPFAASERARLLPHWQRIGRRIRVATLAAALLFFILGLALMMWVTP